MADTSMRPPLTPGVLSLVMLLVIGAATVLTLAPPVVALSLAVLGAFAWCQWLEGQPNGT